MGKSAWRDQLQATSRAATKQRGKLPGMGSTANAISPTVAPSFRPALGTGARGDSRELRFRGLSRIVSVHDELGPSILCETGAGRWSSHGLFRRWRCFTFRDSCTLVRLSSGEFLDSCKYLHCIRVLRSESRVFIGNAAEQRRLSIDFSQADSGAPEGFGCKHLRPQITLQLTSSFLPASPLYRDGSIISQGL